MQKSLYKTELGEILCRELRGIISFWTRKKLKNKVQLILTSPPFPLNQKKNMEIYREKIIKIGLSA